MADKGGGFLGGVVQNLIAAGAAWVCGQGGVEACRVVAPKFVQALGTRAEDALGYVIAGLIFAIWFGVWFFWLRPIGAWWRLSRTGRAKGDKVSILVCDLAGQDGAKAADRVADALIRELGSAAEIRREPVAFARTGYGRVEDRDRSVGDRVRALLTSKKADLAVWGQSEFDRGVLDLVFTAAPTETGATERTSYRLDDTLQLPADFGDQLGTAIAGFAAASVAPHLNSGRFAADVLSPLADRLARIAPTVSGSSAGSLWMALGNARLISGQQSGDAEQLKAAVTSYRAALEEYTRERVPLDWATTQNNLGNALATLGGRESGTARLEAAVAAYQAALQEWTRERVPLNWATTQNNLGSALQTLGQRESGTARLEAAVTAYRAALEERTRERVPLDWATTQNNLGSALQTLGERESGTGRLEESVAAYRAALEEQTREHMPLDWATTQNNLGNALATLGQRESGTARLEAAAAAYRAALEERTRERVPLNWATTQNNLGAALQTLGERESGTARLEAAVAAYQAALEERTREHMPLDWATTHNNLGNAFATLGTRESGTARLEAAMVAYRAALEERTRERVPMDWAATMFNLALVQDALFDRTGDITHFDQALASARAALDLYEAAGANYYIEQGRRLIAHLESRRAALP